MNHIIHITDSNKECIELCKYLLNKEPKEYVNKKINNIYIPWHLKINNQIKKINVNIDNLYIRLANNPNKYKIIDSPHFKYVCNNQKPYIDYYCK